eukprot:3420-Karenia_brevis.AAC.1
MAARGRKGSVVEFTTAEHVNLPQLKIKVRQQKSTFVEGKFVFVDRGKTREEMKPSRMLTRALMRLNDFAATEKPALKLSKDAMRRVIQSQDGEV